jgi:release factor H-coupled RctB family protein
MNILNDTQVRLIASPEAWIEDEALCQFYAAARLEGVRQAVAFPDLHPGKGVPVGATFVTEDLIYPHLIGGDIGCGMALWKTNLLRRQATPDRWAELRFDLEHPWEGNIGGWLQDNQLPSTAFDAAIGTLGGGNHFAELQAVERIHHARAFAEVELVLGQLLVLVHSGSRGFGKSVLRRYTTGQGTTGALPESETGASYLKAHNTALRWARANRELIVHRFLEVLGTEGQEVWDGCHNSITRRPGQCGCVWLHRKGAVAADSGLAVIPGSRGALTYLVKVIGDGTSHAWSLAHGAGRKWSRSESRLRMRERFGSRSLMQTPLGGRVICEARDLLYEEAPAVYKNIEAVIQGLVEASLVAVIATLRPLLTYKTRKLHR